MLLFISFFVFVFFVILLIFIFCRKNQKNKRNIVYNHQKIHFKFSIFKNLYTEFDYEINNDENNPKT